MPNLFEWIFLEMICVWESTINVEHVPILWRFYINKKRIKRKKFNQTIRWIRTHSMLFKAEVAELLMRFWTFHHLFLIRIGFWCFYCCCKKWDLRSIFASSSQEMKHSFRQFNLIYLQWICSYKSSNIQLKSFRNGLKVSQA